MSSVSFNLTHEQKSELYQLEQFCDQAEKYSNNYSALSLCIQKINQLPISETLQELASQSTAEIDPEMEKVIEKFYAIQWTFCALQQDMEKAWECSPAREYSSVILGTSEIFSKIHSFLPYPVKKRLCCVSKEWNAQFQAFSAFEKKSCFNEMKKGVEFLKEAFKDEKAEYSFVMEQLRGIDLRELRFNQMMAEKTPTHILPTMHSIEMMIKLNCANSLKRVDPAIWWSIISCASEQKTPEFVNAILRITDINLRKFESRSFLDYPGIVTCLINEGLFFQARELALKISNEIIAEKLLIDLTVKWMEFADGNTITKEISMNPEVIAMARIQKILEAIEAKKIEMGLD